MKDLPHPTTCNDKYAFTYIIVYSDIDARYHIRYGRIINITEIGVKHSILAKKDWIIVAGEIAIRCVSSKPVKSYEYVMNINSSKMKRHEIVTDKLNQLNRSRVVKTETMSEIKYKILVKNYEIADHTRETVYQHQAFQFYYIMMVQLAYRILLQFAPRQLLRISRNTMILYSETLYESESSTNEYLVPYYEEKIPTCPSDAFIADYNQFGKTIDTMYGACIDKRDKDGTYHHLQVVENNKSKKVIKCLGRRKKKKTKNKIKKTKK